MIIILPIILALVLFVLVFAFGALSVALAATTAAMNSVGKSRASLLIKLLVIAAGIYAFAHVWDQLGPIKDKRFEYIFAVSLKISISLFASAIVLIASALALRITAFVINRARVTPRRVPFIMFGSMTVGILLGFYALNGIETAWNWMNREEPPILLSLTGEPTHCVWRDTNIRDQYGQQGRSIGYIKLDRGQKIRLDPDVMLNADSFTVRFAVEQDGQLKKYYGQSTDFRRLDSRVDADCQW